VKGIRYLSAGLLLLFVLLASQCQPLLRDLKLIPGHPPQPRIHSRREWGSLPISQGYRSHQPYCITLHHSGVEFTGDRSTPEYLRGLQFWSRRDRPWPDIPYHFLIDLEGEIWEGRPIQYVGDTATHYDPTGHILVSLIGNYEVQEVRPCQLRALIRLLAWLCWRYDIPPERIKSHRDYVPSTDCPGAHLYRFLKDGSLIEQVRQKLRR